MVLSGVVALTLSPALAARILKSEQVEKKGFFKWFENKFCSLTDHYVSGVKWLINHRVIGLSLFAGMLVLALLLFKVVPGSFVPAEDQGYLFVDNNLPDAASMERTIAVSDRVVELARSNPAIGDIAQIDGGNMTNYAELFIALKPYDERKVPGRDSFSVVRDLERKLSGIKEATVYPMNPPSIQGLGSSGGFEFYIQNKGSGSPQELDKIARQFIVEARKRKELSGVSCTFSASQQQIYLDVDRTKAELLGIHVSTIYDTLQTHFSSAYVGQFLQYGRIWQVVMQSQPEYRDTPDDLMRTTIRSRSGSMVPLSALATVKYVAGPGVLPRFNGFPAAKLSGANASGYSTGHIFDSC